MMMMTDCGLVDYCFCFLFEFIVTKQAPIVVVVVVVRSDTPNDCRSIGTKECSIGM